MRIRLCGSLLVSVLLIVSVCLAITSNKVLLAGNDAAASTDDLDNMAAIPVPRDAEWMKLYKKINERAKQGDVDLVFIGDSITYHWQTNGKAVWDKFYSNRKAMNAGIGGDRTQHVLWRLENGNLDGIHPKLVVIMIGTNNVFINNTPEEVVEGIKAIRDEVQKKLPDTKILLLGILPREANPKHWIRIFNNKVNALAANLADEKTVFYMDISPKYVAEDEKLSQGLFTDDLHLTTKGYEVWAEAIEPTVKELMAEKSR